MFVSRTIRRIDRMWRGSPVGLTIEGTNYQLGRGQPQAEIVIHDRSLLMRMWRQPSLAFGEAYMRGEIEVHGSLETVFAGFYLAWPSYDSPGPMNRLRRRGRSPKRTSRRRAVANAVHHYNIGNAFYQLWLDPSMTYSCAYFLDESDSLAQAQAQKLDLLCRKARLEPGQHMLDIGCGWGSLLFHAARHYQVQATGLTPAGEQADHIEAEARRQGLDDRVRVVRGDWRDLSGRFDRIISAGMFEHVGLAQYAAFFKHWRELLTDGGLSVLHTIGRMKPEPTDPWIDRYIFPGGYLPTLSQWSAYAAQADLKVMDVENLRRHYARTLGRWASNYQAAWDQAVTMYDESFARMWWLYLEGARAAFRWGDLQLWQTVLAKDHTSPWPLNREVALADAWCGDNGLGADQAELATGFPPSGE